MAKCNLDSRSTDLNGSIAKLYYQTHYRATPWIVGIILGSFVTKHEKLIISKVKKKINSVED